MTDDEWIPPGSYHCIQCAGSIVMVDAEVRKEVEAWLRTLEYPRDHFAYLVITSVIGEEMTLMGDAVNVIYDTTPELRRRCRMYDKLMNEERIEQGFMDD